VDSPLQRMNFKRELVELKAILSPSTLKEFQRFNKSSLINIRLYYFLSSNVEVNKASTFLQRNGNCLDFI
jgi:hypothetical protein